MATPSVAPPVRVVPATVQLMPLVMAVWVTRRALVLLVMLMVMLVPVVPPSVGAVGDADGEGAAADALLDGAAGDVPTVRVPQVMGLGLRMGGSGPSRLLAEGPLGVAGQLARRGYTEIKQAFHALSLGG